MFLSFFSFCFCFFFPLSGQNFTLRQLGICEPASRRGLAFCADMGLPHRGYSISAGSDAETENEGVMSPEHAMRLWGRGVKSGRSSCLSSRSNSALTLTDTEHENKSDSETGKSLINLYLQIHRLIDRYLDRRHTYKCSTDDDILLFGATLLCSISLRGIWDPMKNL